MEGQTGSDYLTDSERQKNKKEKVDLPDGKRIIVPGHEEDFFDTLAKQEERSKEANKKYIGEGFPFREGTIFKVKFDGEDTIEDGWVMPPYQLYLDLGRVLLVKLKEGQTLNSIVPMRHRKPEEPAGAGMFDMWALAQWNDFSEMRKNFQNLRILDGLKIHNDVIVNKKDAKIPKGRYEVREFTSTAEGDSVVLIRKETDPKIIREKGVLQETVTVPIQIAKKYFVPFNIAHSTKSRIDSIRDGIVKNLTSLLGKGTKKK